jgi:hypothetical protein
LTKARKTIEAVLRSHTCKPDELGLLRRGTMAALRCFVIGPMSGDHMATLNWLAYEVIQPLLPDGFDVKTPNLHEVGDIMNQVIRCCDRATLVVANVTGNNPNVLYEIAALDAMGLPCIPVLVVDGDAKRPGMEREEAEANRDQRIAFDRAAYRCFPIYRSASRRAETDKLMRETIANTLRKYNEGGLFENPLTNFYKIPLSSFSSAYGLARTYFLNLVEPAARGISDAFDGREEAVADSACDFGKYTEGKLQIVMPKTLDHAYRSTVDKLKKAGYIKPVSIRAPGRVVTLYEFEKQDDPRAFKWVDIPTTIASQREIVLARLGPDKGPNPEATDVYRELEAEEIDRFRKALQGRISGDSSLELRSMVRIISWDGEGDSAGFPPDL